MSENDGKYIESGMPAGPWIWCINTKTHNWHLCTKHHGQIYVMGAERWGMQGTRLLFPEISDRCVIAPFEDFITVNHNSDAFEIDHPVARAMAEIPDRLVEIARLKAENKVLKEFATEVIVAASWGDKNPDAGAIQQKAKELGLIYPAPATESDRKLLEGSQYKVGAPGYRFTAILKDESEASDSKG